MNTDGLFAFERVSAPADYIPAFRRIADRYVASAIGESDAVVELMDWFDAHGLTVTKGGGIDDWTSTVHMHSVLKDYFYMRGGERDVAMDAQNPTVAYAFPARRLTVWYENEMDKDRNWSERWVAACEAVNWVGCARTEAMALKSSPVWRALGNGAGGYEDWLGNPFPPFAFSSGIHWEDVPREEAIAAGLLAGTPKKRIVTRVVSKRF